MKTQRCLVFMAAALTAVSLRVSAQLPANPVSVPIPTALAPILTTQAVQEGQSMSSISQLRPITKPTKIIRNKPFRASFEEYSISSTTKVVQARGLLHRDGQGNTRTEFLPGSGEHSDVIALLRPSEGYFYLLKRSVKAGLRVRMVFDDKEQLAWAYPVGELVEVGKDKISGTDCTVYRPKGSTSVEVCISETLQLVIQEKSSSGEDAYYWRLSDIQVDASAQQPVEVPAGYTVLSPDDAL